MQLIAKSSENLNFYPFSLIFVLFTALYCRPIIWCQTWIILFYLFILHSNEFIINHPEWAISLHLIAKNNRKTSILTHFCSFLPYLWPCRPLIWCQIWVILFILHNIVMSPNINYSEWTILLHLIAKKFRKTSILILV